MRFSKLAEYLESLEKTSSRNDITSILSDLFKKTAPDEIDKVSYLVLGQLAPSYKGILLNLAEKMMIQIIARAYDRNPEEVRALYKTKGDLGNVAQELAKEQGVKGQSGSINEVYEELLKITQDAGLGSQERKISAMARVLEKLDPLSVRFVARIPVGRLRLGFSEKTIIDALSQLETGNKSAKKKIEAAFNIRPDIGYIAKLIKTGGLERLDKSAKPEVGVPVSPMLAQRLNSPDEMIKKMGTVSVEPKFDGLRIFIHYERKGCFVRIYTRNMNFIENDIFPELKNIAKYIKADEVILDTEAVGVDSEREKILDFQKTIQRRRKHNVQKTAGEIPLQFQIFDILLLNGKSLINTPYRQRRKHLEKIIVNGPLLRLDEHTITDSPEEIKSLHEKYLKMGFEGVVVKKADGFYVSGRTGWNWVKMKEVEGKRGKLSDTIDCVIMGFSVGKGKRAGFGVGQFLAGIKDGDGFKTVTKVGTGLSDELFKNLNKRLKKIEVKDKPKEYEVDKDLAPDFWVLPEVVVELAADELTKSPKHTAGLALRFPRLIKIRDDKSPNQATTLNELRRLFEIQKT